MKNFLYSSQQGWKGLVDNPDLYEEVTALAKRTMPLRGVLQGLQKAENAFTATSTGPRNPYISTLAPAISAFTPSWSTRTVSSPRASRSARPRWPAG